MGVYYKLRRQPLTHAPDPGGEDVAENEAAVDYHNASLAAAAEVWAEVAGSPAAAAGAAAAAEARAAEARAAAAGAAAAAGGPGGSGAETGESRPSIASSGQITWGGAADTQPSTSTNASRKTNRNAGRGGERGNGGAEAAAIAAAEAAEANSTPWSARHAAHSRSASKRGEMGRDTQISPTTSSTELNPYHPIVDGIEPLHIESNASNSVAVSYMAYDANIQIRGKRDSSFCLALKMGVRMAWGSAQEHGTLATLMLHHPDAIAEVGPRGYCSRRHPTHCKPLSLELHGTP